MQKKERNLYIKGSSKKGLNSKAQATVFIILAIIIVALIVLFFIFRGSISTENVPAELEPVYLYYLSCVENEAFNGVSILEQKGGYIENPEFSSGSEYMPFSSELGFLGSGISYWYYVSGNGVAKEQVPSKEKMQSQLNDFIKEGIDVCDFSEFEQRGFNISIGESEVSTEIQDSGVFVSVNQEVSINFGDSSWSGKKHSVSLSSSLGKFYDLAEKIYLKNKDEMFLENYGVDILRLNAPVDGSDIGCSTKFWFVENISLDLINALSINIPSIKLKGSYYTLNKKENEYFVRDLGENVDVGVSFVYLKEWPTKVEVWPSEDGILRADPVGLQEGLGMLGFCYVPYHFVYDFGFPVLIQLYSGSEIFQFPVVVFIDKNQPRESPDVEGVPNVVPELCEHKNNILSVYTYNSHLEPIEADISFKCFDTTCRIGKTSNDEGDSVLIDDFPQCVNGYVIASAEGYETKKQLVSSLQENQVLMFLDKKYKLDLEIQKNREKVTDYSVITFTKNTSATTIVYPEQKSVELSPGQYDIKLYVYSNTSINLKGSKTEKCVDVPKSGIFGAFGLTEEKCFELQVPDQVVDFAISGGGSQKYFVGESELENSEKIIINSDNFGIPRKVEDLQINFNNIEVSGLDISFE